MTLRTKTAIAPSSSEDEFLIALDLEAAMTGLGFEICGLAPNAEEARSLAMNHQPDVVVVDVYLERAREGIETARWLRGRVRRLGRVRDRLYR